MKISTQSASQLGLGIELLVGSRTFSDYVSGRGYDRSHAIREAEEKLSTKLGDEYIFVNKQTQATRTSHPNSDFGDYNVVITGDVYNYQQRRYDAISM